MDNNGASQSSEIMNRSTHVSVDLNLQSKELPDKNKSAKPLSLTKSLFFKIFIGLVLLLVLSQWYGNWRFNQEVKKLKVQSQNIDHALKSALTYGKGTLTDAIGSLQKIEKDNNELFNKNQRLNDKFVFVLPFLKDSSVVDKCNQRKQKLLSLLAKSRDLTSLIQQSEQLDKDIEFIIGSDNISFETSLDKLAVAIKENNAIKTDLVKLVVPLELKYYQDTFIEALSEREKFLTLTDDFLSSVLSALVKKNMALKTYRWSTSYWELEMALDYAAEAAEYLGLASEQVEDAKKHYERYMELKKVISFSKESMSI